MSKSIFTIGFIFLSLLLAVGCGDDTECPNCPTDVDTVTITETLTDTLTDTLEVPQEFLAWVDAHIQLGPEFCIEGYVYANAGANPFIDSLTVGDSVIRDIEADYFWHESDPYFNIDECEDGSEPQYVSGDVGVVRIYGSGLSSECQLVLLDYYDDWAEIIIPDDGDTTIDYNGVGFTCYWTPIEHAEWYGVELNYRLDSSGVRIYRDIYTYTYDTSYTVADTIDGFRVDYVYLYALPTTGPDPETGFSNWTGELATGKLYSTGDYAWADIYFENPPTAFKLPAVSEKRVPDKTPKEIIRAVYEAYK